MDNTDKYIRSYGRIKGKGDLYSLEHLPEYNMQNESLDELKNRYEKMYLEIGFGCGDFICQSAKVDSNIVWVGCEAYLNGINSLLFRIKDQDISNIRIYSGDARQFINSVGQMLFDRVFILFPDPWPKHKHNKRRLISVDLLRSLCNVMYKNAELIIVTDSDDYSAKIRLCLNSVNNILNYKYLMNQLPDNFFETKYYKKAVNLGHSIHYYQCFNKMEE